MYIYIYIHWGNTLLIIPGTILTLKLPIKSHPYQGSIKLLRLPWRSKKSKTILHDRYCLQNCKAITFRKITKHTKYKKPNVPSHLYIF